MIPILIRKIIKLYPADPIGEVVAWHDYCQLNGIHKTVEGYTEWRIQKGIK